MWREGGGFEPEAGRERGASRAARFSPYFWRFGKLERGGEETGSSAMKWGLWYRNVRDEAALPARKECYCCC